MTSVFRLFTALVLLAGVPLTTSALAAHAEDGPRLLDRRDIELEDFRLQSLSPDGRSLVAVNGRARQLCIFAVETMTQETCTDLTSLEAGVRPEDIVWSPDSRYLALAEESFKLFRDGDLWLVDVETGDLTNLTDDGFNGKILFGEEAENATYFFDVNPAWRPDGTAITFSRSIVRAGARLGNVIATVPVTGGEPETLLEVSPDTWGVVYFGMQWTPDGSRLYYNVADPDLDNPDNGLWVVDADGSDAHLVLPAERESGPRVINRISPDGETLLLYYPLVAAKFGGVEFPLYTLYDAATGTVTPIGPAPDAQPGTELIAPVALSPDGTLLLTVNHFSDPPNVVSVRPLDGASAAAELLPEGLPLAIASTQFGIVSWANDGTVLLLTSMASGVLLTIAGGTDLPAASPTPVPEPRTEATPLATGFDPGASVVTNDNDVPLRSSPGTGGQTVATLDAGRALVVIGAPVEADGHTWVPVRDPATETLGWVRVELLDPAG